MTSKDPQSPEPTTGELRRLQRERTTDEHAAIGESATEDEAHQHERRADKAAYLAREAGGARARRAPGRAREEARRARGRLLIKLYRGPLSTNVERVALALAHKGLEVESIEIDWDDRSPVERGQRPGAGSR